MGGIPEGSADSEVTYLVQPGETVLANRAGSSGGGGPEPYTLDIGRLVAGRYRIERRLGKGASAIVYEATDLERSARVALKVLTTAGLEPVLVTRFRQEVEHTRALDHPNVVRLFDSGSDGPLHFLSMELLEGTDLKRLLASERPALAQALRWFGQAAAALEHAHAHGVLHRDVKSANLFVTRTGVVKLTDFGLAKSPGVDGQTLAGTLLGTPEYMAPEIFTGQHPISAATDLYALGVVGYELFCGRVPFQHRELMPLLMMHVHQPPPRPRSLRPELPAEVDRLLLGLVAKSPADRFRSVGALRAELAAIWSHVVPAGARHGAR